MMQAQLNASVLKKVRGEKMFVLTTFLKEISFAVKCSLQSFLGHFFSVIQT